MTVVTSVFQICVNQTCTSVFPYMDQGRCPSNNEEICSGKGVSISSTLSCETYLFISDSVAQAHVYKSGED